MEGDTPRSRLAWAGPLALVALTGVAIALRARGVERFRVDRDALHPFADAGRALAGGTLRGEGRGALGFNFGVLQAWVALPFVALAGSLRQLLLGQAVLHGLVVLPTGLAGRIAGGWGVALPAAAVVAFLPALVAMPAAGGQVYQAPVLVALATWGMARAVARRSALWSGAGSVCLALAVHVHPYAAAVLAGSVALGPTLITRTRPVRLVLSLSVAAALLAPMVADNLAPGEGAVPAPVTTRNGTPDRVADDPGVRGSRPARALQVVAQQGGTASLWTAWSAGLAPGLLLAGVWARTRSGGRDRDAAGRALHSWALATGVAYACLFAVLDYLRPYHLAMAAPLTAVGAAWSGREALTRIAGRRMRPRIALAVGAALLFAGAGFQAARVTAGGDAWVGPWISRLGAVQNAADALARDVDRRPGWLAILLEGPPGAPGGLPPRRVSLLPVRLALQLGAPGRLAPTQAPPPGERWPRAWLLGEMNDQSWRAWQAVAWQGGAGQAVYPQTLYAEQGHGGAVVRLLAFDDARSLARWIRVGCRVAAGIGSWQVEGPKDAQDPHSAPAGASAPALDWPQPCPQAGEVTWWDDGAWVSGG